MSAIATTARSASRASPAGAGVTSHAVVAREPGSSGDDPATRLAVVEALAACASESGVGDIALTVDAAGEACIDDGIAILRRHGVRALPLIALADDGSAASPRPARDPAAVLARLAEHDALARYGGDAYAVVFAEPGLAADAARSVRAGWSQRGIATTLRIGCLRSAISDHGLPDGIDFALDWLPLRASRVAGETVTYDYRIAATEIARRHARDAALAPTIPIAAASEINLPASQIKLTGVSVPKLDYAIDAARRYLHNRDGGDAPFFVLRLPDVAPRTLALAARIVQQAHMPSAAAHAGAAIAPPAVSAARIAVVLHLFYPSLWPDFERALLALPEPCDVFVSCRPRAEGAVRRMVCARFPGAVVYASPNLGRDVWPFLRWLKTPGVERYTYVLKLHSKKSTHIDDASRTPMGSGDEWRNRTLEGLVGSRERVTRLLAALDARRDVGIVAPSGFLYDQVAWRAATGRTLGMLRSRLGIDAPLSGGFPAGTMFWARVESLLPLARALRDDPALVDFEREAGQVDGTLHHAYERFFPLVAAKQGMRTVDASELVG